MVIVVVKVVVVVVVTAAADATTTRVTAGNGLLSLTNQIYLKREGDRGGEIKR